VDVCSGGIFYRLPLPVLHGRVGNPHPAVVDFVALGAQAGNSQFIAHAQKAGGAVAPLLVDPHRHQLRRDRHCDFDSVPSSFRALAREPERQLTAGRLYRVTSVNQVLLNGKTPIAAQITADGSRCGSSRIGGSTQ